ncbi:MAG TPA: carbamoyl phosphate synthase large subunit, partial [Verrucomicrobiae bacterium]|nr:carbamoyl phosphate synthase large subunit [Verrucomicrobiae bacterium]
LSGADPVLGVEMLSTGEVACLGENFSDAFSKALRSAEFNIPDRDGTVFISVGGSRERKMRVVPIAQAFVEMGFKIYATDHTCDVLNAAGINAVKLYKVKEAGATPNVLDFLQERKIDLVINVPIANRKTSYSDILTDGYIIRRQAVEFNVPVITNLQLAAALVDVLKRNSHNGNSIRSLNEYMDELPWKMW